MEPKYDPANSDSVLNWMHQNLPPEKWTLEVYVTLAWFGDKALKDLDAEELSMLPEELYPKPLTKLVQ